MPERAQWLRMILCELNRLSSHFMFMGAFGVDTGVMGTPFIYAFLGREAIIDRRLELASASGGLALGGACAAAGAWSLSAAWGIDRFTVVAMDQRNAGKSIADVTADHGWHTFAADHLALMDHLGFRKFFVMGGCIGGSYCFEAIEPVESCAWTRTAKLPVPVGVPESWPVTGSRLRPVGSEPLAT